MPAETAEILAELKPVRPGPGALRIAQDRLKEKDFLHSIDVATAQYREVASTEALKRAVRDIGPQAVLKTVRCGYDGKGQVAIAPEHRSRRRLAARWAPSSAFSRALSISPARSR